MPAANPGRTIAGVFAWLTFWRPPFLYRLCIVNTISDPDVAIRGVIWRARGAWIVIKQAALIKAGAPATPIDGEAVIHRANVSFIQVAGEAGS